MTDTTIAPQEREEIEMLLPWYVTGRLDAADRARVASWLARDADLARQLALIEAERQQSIIAAQSIAPTARLSATQVLNALPAPGILGRAAAWLDAAIEALSPKGMRLAAVAAALLIAVQSVGIGVLLRHDGGASYETASGPASGSARGTFVLVRLAASATGADLTRTLQASGITIVSGPNADGFYRLRIGPHGMGPADRQDRVAALRREAGLFDLILSEPSRSDTP